MVPVYSVLKCLLLLVCCWHHLHLWPYENFIHTWDLQNEEVTRRNIRLRFFFAFSLSLFFFFFWMESYYKHIRSPGTHTCSVYSFSFLGYERALFFLSSALHIDSILNVVCLPLFQWNTVFAGRKKRDWIERTIQLLTYALVFSNTNKCKKRE